MSTLTRGAIVASAAGLALLHSPPAAAMQRPRANLSEAPSPGRRPDDARTVDLRTIALNQPITFQTDTDPALVQVDVESPFREPETMLLGRTELGFFMSSTDGVSVGGSTAIFDDPAAGEGALAGSSSSHGMGRNVRDAVRADIDNDGRDEMVVLARTSSRFELYRIDVSVQGTTTWQLMHSFAPFTSSQPIEGTLAVGDFDGDRRDEIAVFRTVGPINTLGSTSTFWVIDDPVGGGGVLWEESFGAMDAFGQHTSYSGLAADVDGDGDQELVVARQGGTGTKGQVRLTLYDWSDLASGLFVRMPSQQVYYDSFPFFGNLMTSKLAAGQLDADPADEIALASTTPVSVLNQTDAKLYLDQLNYDVAGNRFDFVQRGTFSGALETTPIPEYSFDVCTFDRYGDGRDWIGLMRKPKGGRADVRAIRVNLGSGGWFSDLVSNTVPLANDAVTLAAGDTDADGPEELYAGFSWGSSTTKASWVELIQAGDTPSSRTIFTSGTATSTASSPTRPLILAPGEYDGDGLRVRYQGSTLRVSNPVPLTLLAAVPTKAGIQQNYVGSSTGYSIGTGSGIETAYSTSTSISAAVGFEFEDFTGTFGASVKATMDYESSSTQTATSTTTFVTGYEASHDEDVIVFASNNYLVHEYRILSAPDADAVGRTFTIDVPLETQINKWTVPFYNDRVEPRYRMTSSLLPHTVGDPSTYRNFSEMAATTAGVVSWNTPTTITVGQGNGGSVSTAIELASENATTEQTSMAVGAEASYKAFGVTTEGSISFGSGSAYTVSTNTETVYQGQIGDVAAGDYSTWAYSVGLYVYQAWRVADGSNRPTGAWLPGGYPLTVINFWTNPFGSGY
ncbi:FG-GAP repeat protein [Planctomycetes bacterium Poly30]|uniref:FG-GAP repeat protein n=1 Tax=Saltatorellus ferox TaxID=2528018 RepID=A0A518EV70_9BACT|nr:FG-GAP repeat protein [Planctomycetes bacterium Poly30]